MIIETTRIMRRWIEHPEHGLHQQIPLMPRLRLDGLSDDAPPLPTIYDDVDDANEVRNFDPPSHPALVLYVDSTAQVDVDQLHYLKSEVPLVLAAAYLTRDQPDDVAVKWGGYTARALRRCLRTFNSQTHSQGYRELNGIKVMKVGLVTELPVATAVGQSRLWGFVLASITVVDSLA